MAQVQKEREMLYICSPLRGDVQQNIQNAMNYCAQAIKEGFIPIAPHVMYQGMFDDEIPDQRADALEIGLQLLDRCSCVWVCGGRISEGMQGEIEQARSAGMPIEQKPAAYFHEMQRKEPLTFRGLYNRVEQAIHSCEKQPDKILELLDLKAQHHQYSLTNAAAIHQQNPDAQFVTTYHEWRKLGYHVEEWRHSIKVWTPVQNQTFLRDGTQVDIQLATRQEREAIIQGDLTVQAHTTYRMNLVYDISQTSCPKDEYVLVMGNPYISLEKEQLYACVKELSLKCGLEVKESTTPDVVALKGYYHSGTQNIYISQKLHTEEKLSAFCSAFAQGMVDLTSELSQPVQEFEAQAFSYLLHRRFGLAISDTSRQELIATFANTVEQSGISPTDCIGHLQKAGNFTLRGIDKEIAELKLGMDHEQTAQKEMSQEQKETLKNFMQGIE